MAVEGFKLQPPVIRSFHGLAWKRVEGLFLKLGEPFFQLRHCLPARPTADWVVVAHRRRVASPCRIVLLSPSKARALSYTSDAVFFSRHGPNLSSRDQGLCKGESRHPHSLRTLRSQRGDAGRIAPVGADSIESEGQFLRGTPRAALFPLRRKVGRARYPSAWRLSIPAGRRTRKRLTNRRIMPP